MANVETTLTPVPLVLIRPSLNLLAASNGVFVDTSNSISGAQSTIDFQGAAIKRFTVTGPLTGAYANPPSNIPELADDGQSVTLTVVFIQDSTGGHSIPLVDLFANYDPYILGSDIVDDSPGGVTVVDIVARRNLGVVTYTVNLTPTFDASQIDSGILSSDRLPAATDAISGAVTLSTGSGGAAAGNHTHSLILPAKFTIQMSNGSAIPNGDYELIVAPSSGSVVRLTRARLYGGTNPTATISAKVGTTTVTGTGLSVTSTAYTASGDATANNTFVELQMLYINIASVAGNPTMLDGTMHYSLNSQPWSGS